MSLVEQYHEAHKARLSRMGVVHRYVKPRPVSKPIEPIDPTPYYRNMWFWDLLNVPVTSGGYRPSVKRIMQVVSRHYDISMIEMISSRRTKNLAFPRQVAMFLSRQMTPLSLPQIGRQIGGRDHTTVLHGCRQIERRLKNSPEFESIIERLKGEMGALK